MPFLLASTLNRYVFENPWPLAALLAVAGAILGWLALTQGDRPKRNVALVLLAAAALVVTLAKLVTTSGEHATRVVEELVQRAEASDTDGMLELMTAGCSLHYGRPENPGVPREQWLGSIRLLQGQYRIDENKITRLDAESVSSNAATVELGCLTTVSIAGFPTPSSWWMRVEKQPDDTWRITRIAALQIGRETPSPGTF